MVLLRLVGGYPLVTVDPHHAGVQRSGDAVGARQIGSPQPAAMAVLDAVGQLDHLVVGPERDDRDERPETLFPSHGRPRFGSDPSAARRVAASESGIVGRAGTE